MAKKDKHLKLSSKGIIILIIFIVGMVVATYFFTSYLLTGSSAAARSRVKTMPDGKKYWCTDSGSNCYSGFERIGSKAEVDRNIRDFEMKAAAEKAKERVKERINKQIENPDL